MCTSFFFVRLGRSCFQIFPKICFSVPVAIIFFVHLPDVNKICNARIQNWIIPQKSESSHLIQENKNEAVQQQNWKKLFASISSKRFQLCLSSVSYDYCWLLNQAYLHHKLERSNENEKFNRVTFVNIEDFSMQNDAITLTFTKN